MKYIDMNWYKISQNQSPFARLEELTKQRDDLEVVVESLSRKYLELTEIDKRQSDKFYDENLLTPSNEYRNKRDEWEREVKRLVSLGLMTIQEAKERGYRLSGHESQGWQALPKILYHVTTAKTKVIKEGLKSRDELKQLQGVGLGGGESNTISFTTDLKIAYAILNGLLEMKQVVEGKLTVRQMLEMAKNGVGAKAPYFDDLVEGAIHAVGNLDDLAEGYTQESSLARPPDDKHEWTPVEESGWQGRDQRYYGRWKRKRNPEEQLFSLYIFYGRFSSARESAGGIENPLFFSADIKVLANIPESEIAILEFKSKPNAMGYPVGGLLEWRVGTGENVEFVKEIKAPKYITTGNEWYQLYKISMANRWIPNINDPDSQLEFLFDCTSIRQKGWESQIIDLMDNNNEWQPNEKTQRYLERFVGAMKDDYALRFKYCVFQGKPYISAYFSAIHYVFKVVS